MTAEWPFNTAELTAGLRRYLADNAIEVRAVREEKIVARPATGRIRGVGLDIQRAGMEEHYSYILKEPYGTPQGVAGAGRREAGLYKSIGWQLPIPVPELVVADAQGQWLLLEPYHTVRAAELWTANDYRQAVIQLARLHDRFWNLSEDLAAYPWVGRPLTADFDVYMYAAAKGLGGLIDRSIPVAEPFNTLSPLVRLMEKADFVAELLQSGSITLLHGDYWPGNIAIDEDERQVVYDWQLVGVGPAVMDLVVFIQNSLLWLGPLPVDTAELIQLYRTEMASASVGRVWSESEWQFAWDFSLMWRFIQQWLGVLPQAHVFGFEATPERNAIFQQIWLDPVCTAVNRWLNKVQ